MSQEYIKHFDEWGMCSKNLDSSEFKGFFHEREIWWCALGVNIGSEQDGIGDSFERPVLVLRSIRNDLLMIVPFTTKITNYQRKHRDTIPIDP